MAWGGCLLLAAKRTGGWLPPEALPICSLGAEERGQTNLSEGDHPS